MRVEGSDFRVWGLGIGVAQPPGTEGCKAAERRGENLRVARDFHKLANKARI